MKFEKEKICKFISEQCEISAPMLQKKFSLSYAECKSILDELIGKRMIEYVSGVTYIVHTVESTSNKRETYKPQNEQEAFFIKALWACVEHNGASTSLIQRRFSVGYARAARAIDWMEGHNFISAVSGNSERTVLIDREEFISKFGDLEEDTLDDDEEDEDDYEERQRFIEERRRELMERMRRMNEEDDSDDDSNDEDDDNDSDDEGDEDDNDEENLLSCDITDFDSRLERMLNSIDDYKKNTREESEEIDLRPILSECILSGLQDKNKEEKYILNLNGEKSFELKFVAEGSALRISDGGKTFAQSGLTMRKVKYILKHYVPVAIEDTGEIYIEIDDPHSTLMAFLTFYTAVDAVRRASKSPCVDNAATERAESIGKLCRVLKAVAKTKK